ncbi:MAG TPA: TetR/AcrR family transcriptional regulator [Acidimicrobiia bacterium]|nr:TetR/AcrR family transcriptional regulator [Acidimicrobiia bacterium]
MMSAIPTRDRRAERREATRAEILEAAWELMHEHGVAGLSLRDLGEKVGMRAQSLYSYFDSKEAIYDALFEEGFRECFEQLRRAAPAGDARADFRARCRTYVDFCLEDPARYQLLFQRTIPGFEPSSEAYAPSVEALELTKQALAAAGASDPRDLDLYTGLVTGLIDQQISNDPGGDRWYRLLDEVLDMFFAHADARDKGDR